MKPLVLLTNDDGINNLGMHTFRKYLERFFEVYIVAPLIERSTTSHTLSLHKPLHLTRIDEKTFAVDGYPADCTYMGIFKLLPRKPDLVLAGINQGANIGQDVFYSGTVAAARQAVLNDISAVASSLVYKKGTIPFWGDASDVISKYIYNNFDNITQTRQLLNINYPNIKKADLKGIKIVPFGERVYKDEVVTKLDPRGNEYHWIGGDYKTIIRKENTDCVCIENNYMTVTPIAMNATDFNALDRLAKWNNGEL